MVSIEQQTFRDKTGPFTRPCLTLWGPRSEPQAAATVEIYEPPLLATFDGSERYEILERLGTGGMAQVHAAFDKVRSKRVAMKIAANTSFAKRRLLEEASVLRGFAHPNVATVLDMGFLRSERPFYTMDVVPGLTLRDLVRQTGPLPTERIVDIVLQLCSALAPVHAAGFVHHDVTPSNVMIDCTTGNDWNLCLIDFGLARSSAEPFDGPRYIVGTPGYIAPEVINGAPSDCRADIYGVGAIAMLLLCGYEPEPTSPFPLAVSERVRGSGARLELARAVEQCLSEHPEDRFASIAELRDSCLLTRITRVRRSSC